MTSWIKRDPYLRALIMFYSRVNLNGNCWLWTGPKNIFGYGMTYLYSKHIGAHRASYILHVGQIGDRLQIDHLCRVRDCVKPNHLEAVTAAENNRREDILITHCPKMHSYSDENTYWNVNRRFCRTCGRTATNDYHRRRRSFRP